MFTRRKSAILFSVMILATIVVAWLSIRSRDSVSVRNFERIQPGMTLEQVSEILGRPPAESTMRAPYAGSYDPKEFRETGVVDTRFWYSEELTAQVGFNEAGVVVWKGAGMAPIPRWRDDSFAGRFRRWFRF
jgi:SmpA / OmlA family